MHTPVKAAHLIIVIEGPTERVCSQDFNLTFDLRDLKSLILLLSFSTSVFGAAFEQPNRASFYLNYVDIDVAHVGRLCSRCGRAALGASLYNWTCHHSSKRFEGPLETRGKNTGFWRAERAGFVTCTTVAACPICASLESTPV
jgi:hypothetical protein